MKKYNRTQNQRKKRPDPGVDELLESAESPKPKTSYTTGPHDTEPTQKQTRESRLVPALPPITPADYF
jgi:hypothetical protein